MAEKAFTDIEPHGRLSLYIQLIHTFARIEKGATSFLCLMFFFHRHRCYWLAPYAVMSI